MLTRNSQIGEFYVLQPPQVDPTDGGKEPAKGKFTCDALIYDEESDRHVRVTWAQALEACCIDNLTDVEMSHPTTKKDANGNLVANTMPDKMLSSWNEKAKQWIAFNEGKTPKDAAGNELDYTKLDTDIRIVIARPFIEHLMHSVVMAVSGRDTGATLFGPADSTPMQVKPLLPPHTHRHTHSRLSALLCLAVQLSANTQVKTIEGHYTGHFKAVVTKPQNVLVMRDVACAGYVAGCNTLFFAQGEDGSMSATTAATNLMERLSFSNDVGAKYASMLAFPATAQQFSSGHLDTVMSVTTRLLPWEVTSATGGTHSSFPGGQKVFEEYQRVLNLRSIHFGEDMKAAENQDFISQAR